MFRVFFFLIALFCSTGSFSGDVNYFLSEKEKLELESILSINPQDIYDSAIENIRNKNYNDALDDLSKIDLYYSHSSFYFKAKLLLPYVYLLNNQYSLARSSVNVFLSLYPEYEDIDFVYYLRGEIDYNNALHQSFGRRFLGKKNININSYYGESINSFGELIKNYPDSKYFGLAKEKVSQVNDLIFVSKLDLARYYQRDKKSLAAIKILYHLLDNYSNSKFVPESLFRIIEIYFHWGLDLEVINVSKYMQNNYPNSIWTSRILDNFLKKNFSSYHFDETNLEI